MTMISYSADIHEMTPIRIYYINYKYYASEFLPMRPVLRELNHRLFLFDISIIIITIIITRINLLLENRN